MYIDTQKGDGSDGGFITGREMGKVICSRVQEITHPPLVSVPVISRPEERRVRGKTSYNFKLH